MLFFLLALDFSQGKKEEMKPTVEYIDEGLRSRVENSFNSTQLENISGNSEKHQFQAEIARLMNILVDSLYQNKEIFMREMISNANDALDKIRIASLRNQSILDICNGSRNFQILIDVNEDDRTISITDTGIGMTKRDLIENLGRIAKSGTSEFQRLLQSGDTNLIGKFGVGFYSAFLVSDKVTVISKHNADPTQWIWQSDATQSFSITPDPRGVTLNRGTQIILHLKDNALKFLNRDYLTRIISHYSMFVDFPVRIWNSHEVLIEESEQKEDDLFSDVDDIFDPDSDGIVSDDDDKPVTMKDGEKPRGPTKIVWQWDLINDKKPLWLQNPSEIPDSDYTTFYKAYCKDTTSPLYHMHFKGEGRLSFNALLFIPSHAPSQDQIMEKRTKNVRLYVKRILVSDEWGEELLPTYLHFIKGVIDSSDLTLNVDRDHLQQENTLRLIKRRVTSKVLSVFRHLFQFEPGLFYQFYQKFAGNLKYGVIEDSSNRQALSKLLMFYSSYSPNDLTRLDDYVSRMKKGQEKIYYIGSSTRESAAVSPYLEDLYSKGIEVLFAVEPIDLYCLDNLEDFDGIPLENPEQPRNQKRMSVSDMASYNLTQADVNTFSSWFKKVIGNDKIDRVSLSTRLKKTPAICTAPTWGYSASHEHLLRAQTVYDQKLAENLLSNKKVLELNPSHPTIISIFEKIKNTPDDEQLKEEAKLLFDTALLAGGFTVDGISNYTKRVFKMMSASLGIEDEVEEFEENNTIFYTTIDDEFKVNKNNNKNKRKLPSMKPIDLSDLDDDNDDKSDLKDVKDENNNKKVNNKKKNLNNQQEKSENLENNENNENNEKSENLEKNENNQKQRSNKNSGKRRRKGKGRKERKGNEMCYYIQFQNAIQFSKNSKRAHQ